MNKTVTASGMMVKAQAEGNIVITAGTLPASGTKATDYNFAETVATELYASTHDSTYGTYETGLKRVTNAENINLETGLRKNSSATLTYANAGNVTGKTYYKDYTVYIAGDAQAFSGQDLTVSLSGTFATAANTINKAISVDFYGASVTTATSVSINSTNYKGTLNVAGTKNNSDGNGTTAYTSFVISNIDIPQASGSAAYAITMRVYYDGALIETGGTNAYTTYAAATGTAEAGKYYYTADGGASIATVATDASVTGLWVVDAEASTFAYARTTDVNKLQNVTLSASFVATDH